MGYLSFIKEGFHTVNKNWQLVIIQFIATIVSVFGFFIIVGMPIAIAFVVFGIDLTEILRLRDLQSVFWKAVELLNKYFALAIIIILSLLLYLISIIVLWGFNIGGTFGILGRHILNGSRKFTFRAFFAEGRALFLPLFLFSIAVAIILVIPAFALGFLRGVTSFVVEILQNYDAALSLFFATFFKLLFYSATFLLLILVPFATTAYGSAYIVFNRVNPIKAIKGTIRFLYSTPSSIVFLCTMFVGFVAISFTVMSFLVVILFILPVIAPILSFFYLIVNVMQWYLILVIFSSAYHYYYRMGYSSKTLRSGEDSDTSPKIENAQTPLPEETGTTRQE